MTSTAPISTRRRSSEMPCQGSSSPQAGPRRRRTIPSLSLEQDNGTLEAMNVTLIVLQGEGFFAPNANVYVLAELKYGNDNMVELGKTQKVATSESPNPVWKKAPMEMAITQQELLQEMICLRISVMDDGISMGSVTIPLSKDQPMSDLEHWYDIPGAGRIQLSLRTLLSLKPTNLIDEPHLAFATATMKVTAAQASTGGRPRRRFSLSQSVSDVSYNGLDECCHHNEDMASSSRMSASSSRVSTRRRAAAGGKSSLYSSAPSLQVLGGGPSSFDASFSGNPGGGRRVRFEDSISGTADGRSSLHSSAPSLLEGGPSDASFSGSPFIGRHRLTQTRSKDSTSSPYGTPRRKSRTLKKQLPMPRLESLEDSPTRRKEETKYDVSIYCTPRRSKPKTLKRQRSLPKWESIADPSRKESNSEARRPSSIKSILKTKSSQPSEGNSDRRKKDGSTSSSRRSSCSTSSSRRSSCSTSSSRRSSCSARKGMPPRDDSNGSSKSKSSSRRSMSKAKAARDGGSAFKSSISLNSPSSAEKPRAPDGGSLSSRRSISTSSSSVTESTSNSTMTPRANHSIVLKQTKKLLRKATSFRGFSVDGTVVTSATPKTPLLVVTSQLSSGEMPPNCKKEDELLLTTTDDKHVVEEKEQDELERKPPAKKDTLEPVLSDTSEGHCISIQSSDSLKLERPEPLVTMRRRRASTTWKCPCGFESEVCNQFCGMCGTKRYWACTACKFENNMSLFAFCGMCGVPKTNQNGVPEQDLRKYLAVSNALKNIPEDGESKQTGSSSSSTGECGHAIIAASA